MLEQTALQLGVKSLRSIVLEQSDMNIQRQSCIGNSIILARLEIENLGKVNSPEFFANSVLALTEIADIVGAKKFEVCVLLVFSWLCKF